MLSSDGAETLATTTVSFISPHVDDQTQSVLVKGTVRNPDGTLRSSQFVRARIVWKTAEGLVVPVTAVLRINGQFFAFVAEEAGGKLTAKQRPIKVGPIVGDDYPVLDGIKAGDRVVVSGAQKLADGAPIGRPPRPNQRPQPPNDRVRRHLHQASDPGERLLARDHPRGRDRDPDAADRAVPGAGAADRSR